ncbi:MAG: hypothetical protein NTX14_01275 [Candidatus Nealsonbacteria bacterium]|nr:hypothetical protein [Candidatus Nealsonbacteria bacterium]
MKEFLLQLLLIAYGVTGFVALLAYFPTMVDLYVHKKPSANIVSYVIWTVVSGIAFLYGLFILNDFLFRMVSGIEFGACAIVLFLSLRLRNRIVRD